MVAKFATVDERVLARMEETAALRAESIIARGASDKSQTGGMQFDCGYLSPYFVTDPERMEVVFENAYVLIHEKRISLTKDLLPLLEQVTNSGRPLLIIAEDVEGEALATLVVNKLRGPLRVAAVRALDLGDQRENILRDIARLTNGKAITEDLDIQLKNVRISNLGQAKKITIGKNRTVIEGRAHYEQLLFGPDPCAHSSAYTSPMQSSETANPTRDQRPANDWRSANTSSA